MEVLGSIRAVREKISKLRLSNKSIGLVPTMGSLHEGHLELVRRCIADNDITVCSIYVNPTQFNNSGDLKNYPKNLSRDLEQLESCGCDFVFTPDDKEMYPDPPRTSLDFGPLENVMEGKFRTGHFKGVGIVVAKLFNIVLPDRAYFGEKDLQQLMIIRQLVRDLDFGIEIVGIPTVRESSGLAMSSRNERLDPDQRISAATIFYALKKGVDSIRKGEGIERGRSVVLDTLKENQDLKPEYVEIVDMANLSVIEEVENEHELAICTAVQIGEVRLIDNIIFKTE